MSKELNATCAICGKKYHVCNTCKSVKTLKPWRTIADTVECYKIYMIIHDYVNKSISKEKAKNMLDGCTVPPELQEHIKTVIDEIKSIDIKSKKEIKKGVSDNNPKNNE